MARANASQTRKGRPSVMVSEAEVSLRFALRLLDGTRARRVAVNVDGAVLKLQSSSFPIAAFLSKRGWARVVASDSSDWRGKWTKQGREILLASGTGEGDVVLRDGKRRLVAECKGGPARKSRNGRERIGLQNAIGQLVTKRKHDEAEILVVAVPDTPEFRRLGAEFRRAPLVRILGISIVFVVSRGVTHLPRFR